MRWPRAWALQEASPAIGRNERWVDIVDNGSMRKGLQASTREAESDEVSSISTGKSTTYDNQVDLTEDDQLAL